MDWVEQFWLSNQAIFQLIMWIVGIGSIIVTILGALRAHKKVAAEATSYIKEHTNATIQQTQIFKNAMTEFMQETMERDMVFKEDSARKEAARHRELVELYQKFFDGMIGSGKLSRRGKGR